MKTRIIQIFVFSILLSACSFFNKENNDLDKMNLNGKIKSIRESSFQAIEKFGEVTKGIKAREDEWEFDYIRTYNHKGNIIESNEYNSDGSLNFKRTYEYDDKGNKIKSNEYKSDGSLGYKSISKYDNKGNLIEGNVCKLDGIQDYRWTLKYDDKGNLIKKEYYGLHRPLKNNTGQWIAKRGPWKITLKSSSTFKYEFDNKGNWIKRIDFYNNIPEHIIEREIEYF